MAAPTTGNDYASCVASPEGFGLNMRYRCQTHGGLLTLEDGLCQTIWVLRDVQAERTRQFAKYGTNAGLDDGTGPDVRWIPGWYGAEDTEKILRADYEIYKHDTDGPPTWMHLVREEIAETFKETDPASLRAELIQVAALAVSWIEKIDARSAGVS